MTSTQTPPREPTADECSANLPVDGGIAVWYPSMGGYVGKAVAYNDNGCINLWVWHDGEFPFSGTTSSTDCWCWCLEDDQCPCCKDKVTQYAKRPHRVHHCDPVQFIDFAYQLISSLKDD